MQLYIHQRVASRARPVRLLKGLARVTLAAGAATRITLPLSRGDCALVGDTGRWQIEPGIVDVWAAASAADPGLHATTTLR